jgi:hypothetical protein
MMDGARRAGPSGSAQRKKAKESKESHMNTRQLSRPVGALLMLGASLGCMAALAADKAGVADAQLRYQQERAACLSGSSNQDRATCLREAGAALAEAKRSGLGDGTQPYERNAHQRCERLPDEDRRACDARMQGQGTTSGSAAAGGIYRELVTREPIAPNAVQPDSGAASSPTR